MFIILAGLVFLWIAVNYHTFRNYKTAIQDNISKIQETKQKVRLDVDELETLSVPEMEGFCESLCSYLSGKMESRKLDEKMEKINLVFEQVYSGIESKHIQDELLKSINQNVNKISVLHKELKENQKAYEKLLAEKPYSFVGKLLHFEAIQLPWEKEVPSAMAA